MERTNVLFLDSLFPGNKKICFNHNRARKHCNLHSNRNHIRGLKQIIDGIAAHKEDTDNLIDRFSMPTTVTSWLVHLPLGPDAESHEHMSIKLNQLYEIQYENGLAQSILDRSLTSLCRCIAH